MNREWQVTDVEELGVIMNIVHDWWFDVEDVSFDAGVGKLSVRFQRPSIGKEGGLFKKRGPLSDWVLEIASVESYELTESEHVGRYDFNEIVYSQGERRITITTGIPLAFYAVVTSLEVSVREVVV